MSKPSGQDTWLELAPEVRFRRVEQAILVVAEDVALEIGGDLATGEEVLAALRRGAWLSTLVPPAKAYAIVAELAAQRWLVTERFDSTDSGQFQQVVRWLGSITSRPLAAFKALQQACVAILGVGGLGGEVAQHLVGAGVGSVILIDGDIVELANLNRQFLFDHTSLGHPKVEAASTRLRARNPLLETVAIRKYVQTTADLSCLDRHRLDLIINCADQPKDLDRIAASYCGPRKIPFVTGGVGVHRGYWGPFLIDSIEDALCQFERQLMDAQGTLARDWDRSHACTSSHGPFNSIVAAHLASDVIRHLSGASKPQSLGRRLFLNFERLAITPVGAI